MRPFHRDGDELVATLTSDEAGALTLVLSRVVGLVEEDVQDSGLARLFPDGYRDDPEAAAELRDLIRDDLREQKIQNAHTVLATLPDGGEVRLSAAQAETWLTALNDARLVIGEWLDISATTSLDDELRAAGPETPRGFLILVYDLLTYLLDSLVGALID